MAYDTTQVVKIKLKHSQLTKVEQSYGNVRYAYNWVIESCEAAYEAWQKNKSLPHPIINFNALNALWTRERPAFTRSTARASQTRAIMYAANAYIDFFKTVKHNNKGAGVSHPRYHKKGVKDACYFTNDNVLINGSYIYIPKIGWTKMLEPIKIKGELRNYVLKRCGDSHEIHFHFTCAGSRPKGNPRPGSVVAVDVGLKTPATAVNDLGEVFTLHMPDTVKALTRRIKHEQRILSRRHKGSKRWLRQKKKIQRLQQTKSNIKIDAINKFTSDLTKNHETVITETLNCSRMRKTNNTVLRRALSDSGMSEILQQLKYKAHIYVAADIHYKSSKICSNCGHVKETLSLNDRIYICDNCGFTLDRDENAARNLLHSGVGSPSALVESIATQ